jgi:acyl carrier protein phosphodiesterase
VNFLAHFHLAWPDELLVVGGLEGDFHKGPLPGSLSPALVAGVTLHRAIDAYTDAHPAVAEVRRGFPPELRRYAGILIDLCFDHFLALRWQAYSELAPADFNEAVYAMLGRHAGKMSTGARRMASRLHEYDVLHRYREWDTITASATRIGERLRHRNPLADSHRLLPPLLPDLEQTFTTFYPELIRFSRGSDMLRPIT